MINRLECAVSRDTGAHVRRVTLDEFKGAARERAAECADVLGAVQRLLDTDYDGYCALQDALIKQDTKRAGEILQVAFEVEVNIFVEEIHQ